MWCDTFFRGSKTCSLCQLQTYCSFKWWSNQNKTSEVFAGKKWPKLVTSTGSLKNEQSKKCSDSQPEIYTYFKYVLKMNSQKKNSIEGKELQQLKIYETNLDVFISCWKNLAVVEWKIISTVGDARAVMAVAVAERFEQKSFYGLSAKKKQVAVLERMPLEEVRVHTSQSNTRWRYWLGIKTCFVQE